MGGEGSGRLNKTDALIRQTTRQQGGSRKPEAESRVPIMSEMFIPNLSGDHSHGNVQRTPTAAKDIVNKEYVDTALLGNLTPASVTTTGILSGSKAWIRDSLYVGGNLSGSRITASGNLSGSNLWVGNANIVGNLSGSNILATSNISGSKIIASSNFLAGSASICLLL
jgi:hypothetical protein